MSEKIRNEFEEWFIAESGINCLEICDIVDGRRGNFYSDPEPDIKFAMNISWQAWQASRAALVVELPANCKGMALTVDELRVMMKKIGVTLK